ncbi:MAG: asparagine synthase (glutamine-hydrolyzing) [Microvirga sp.]
MCGLYASIAFAPERARIDRVAHRGPDGSGWREFASAAGPVALGHRRLAIIDLSEAGLQPMADASGRYHLVLNGEIYNYLELRDELRAKGHQFSSDTDSEVLLAAYREWGEDCLHRFLGMFAFLIWDEREQILFAARDRFGIKPLYMAGNQRGIAFASEIKQLLGLPGLSGRMNLARVRDFLAAGMSDHTEETLFEGVVQLQPGCCVAIAAGRAWTGRIEPKRWYAIPPHGTLRLSEAEAAEQFRSLLVDSVRLHLRSDAPIGSCLSGGLDSSSIVCLMSRMLDAEGRGARVNTVSACYDEKAVDETPFMAAVVAHAGAIPHRVFPRPEDVFARASDLTWHQDEPFGSTSIFAQWCVFEEARRAGIKVMLDGQGADEALAGYHWTYAWHLLTLIRQGRLTALASTVSQRVGAHGCGVVDQLTRLAAVALPPRLAQALKAGRNGAGRRWLRSEAFGTLAPDHGALELASAINGLPQVIDVATLCVVLTFSANLQMLLHWEDRNSMAHSIEARVPFLDHRLVEFALALGNDHKLVGADTKRVLRRAMTDVLPPAILARRDKLGFATPEQAWFRGPLKPLILDGVEATLARFPGLLDARATRALVSAMLEGQRPVDFTAWRIVSIGLWGERFGVTL